jgi:hypothetical protein
MILALALPLVALAGSTKHDPEPECLPCPEGIAQR